MKKMSITTVTMKRIWFIGAGIVIVAAFIYVMVVRGAIDRNLEAAFENTNCPEPEPREYPTGYYAGPLWDTHIHIPTIFDGPFEKLGPNDMPVLGGNVTMGDIMCTFATEGTEKAFGFFSVYRILTDAMVKVAARTVEQYPGQFVPFIMPPDRDDMPSGSPTVDAETLKRMLDVSPGLFKGYGEIGLYAREDGSAELPPDDPEMLAIYDALTAMGISLAYVHLGVGHEDNLARAADMYPHINYIFHGDQLVMYEEDAQQNLSAIDELLTNHPNIFYGIDELYGDDFLLRPEVSKEAFFSYFNDYGPLLEEDIATWSAFIERHPTQVLWGTDRGWSSAWSLDIETGLLLTDYARAFIGRLDEDVRDLYAYKNAERLLNSTLTQGANPIN